MVEHWEAAQKTLEAIATFLLQSIRTTTSTAALLLVADLLQTLVSRCGAEVGVEASRDDSRWFRCSRSSRRRRSAACCCS